MILGEQQGMHLIFPWQDRKREFSWLKATTLALMFVPAIWIVYEVATDNSDRFVGGMTDVGLVGDRAPAAGFGGDAGDNAIPSAGSSTCRA